MYKNIFLIVAMTEKTRGIGSGDSMLYDLREDLEYFKKITEGSTIVVSRRTYNTFNVKPLPNRKNIILSKKNEVIEKTILMNSVDEVLEYANKNSDEKVFICGGAEIYNEFMEYANKMYITLIEEKEDIKAKVNFPKIDSKSWRVAFEEVPMGYEKFNPKFKFTIWERV